MDDLFHHALDELDAARNALAEAASWVRSDWSPVGSTLTDAQSAARAAVFDAVGAAKATIDTAKAALWEAL